MNSALQLLAQFQESTADGFPLGEQGAEVLDQLERVGKLLEEAKAYYKAQLAKSPHCVPGWTLKPGAVRRSLGDAQAVWEKLQERALDQAVSLCRKARNRQAPGYLGASQWHHGRAGQGSVQPRTGRAGDRAPISPQPSTI